jgi:hypothetical protein
MLYQKAESQQLPFSRIITSHLSFIKFGSLNISQKMFLKLNFNWNLLVFSSIITSIHFAYVHTMPTFTFINKANHKPFLLYLEFRFVHLSQNAFYPHIMNICYEQGTVQRQVHLAHRPISRVTITKGNFLSHAETRYANRL